jgi:hypothetical protein
MNASELKLFLRHDGSFRDDPGSPLDRPHATITINTSSETFVFNGNGHSTPRRALDSVRLARAGHGTATPRDKRCHAAILADKGAVALIVFARKIEP